MSFSKIVKSIKSNIKIILIVLILILNLILLFKPNLFNNKASIIGIREKNRELEELNLELNRQTLSSGTKRSEIAELKVRDNELEKQANVNKIEIDPKGLEFHLPSILIRLEDSSKRNNLNLSVNYNGIAYENLQGDEIKLEEDSEKDSEEDKENKNDQLSQEESTSKEEKAEVNSNKKTKTSQYNLYLTPEEMKSGSTKEDSDLELEDAIESEAKRYSDRGIEVTTIPIKVLGTYDGVKNFIKDLDRFNYMEPTKINMKSLGEKVEANIIISIFHGDIFK